MTAKKNIHAHYDLGNAFYGQWLDSTMTYSSAKYERPGQPLPEAQTAKYKALAQSINDYWMKNGRPNMLLLSFHGVPRRALEQGDPYHCHCHKTGRLLATELGLSSEQYVISFQSRFGRAAWLTPYTQPTLLALAKKGVSRIDVACPGFVSDCLETLEEIAQEGQAQFLKAGGKEFHYIPCLNERPAWITALADLAVRNLHGWLEPPADAAAREMTLVRAKALGALS